MVHTRTLPHAFVPHSDSGSQREMVVDDFLASYVVKRVFRLAVEVARTVQALVLDKSGKIDVEM